MLSVVLYLCKTFEPDALSLSMSELELGYLCKKSMYSPENSSSVFSSRHNAGSWENAPMFASTR